MPTPSIARMIRVRLANLTERWCWRRCLQASILLACLAILATGLALYISSNRTIPEHRFERAVSRVVLARDGTILRVRANARGEVMLWRKLDAVSPKFVAAVIHAEDKRFYHHPGVDPVAILRSSWINIRAGAIKTGASTITQQTIGLLPGDERVGGRWSRKFDEVSLALALERQRSKERILTEYVNRAPFGNRRVGVEAAARYYFGMSAGQLTWAQAAYLAALPRAPSRLSDPAHRAEALAIQRHILTNMHRRGALSERALEGALSERIEILSRESEPGFDARDAMHVSEHVLARHPQDARIETTIDANLQREVAARLRSHVERREHDGISQAAAVVLDTSTGEVLAWVGSRGYFHRSSLGANDGVVTRRRPGSTLKPFVYARYLEEGGTLADPIADLPTHLKTRRGSWSPENFDRRFHGPVSVRESLAGSLNVPAVLVANVTGVPTLIEDLRALGMPMMDRAEEDHGLGLALGNAEVSLLELAAAYATFGRGGRWRPASTSAMELAVSGEQERQVYSPEVAFLILDALSDDRARVRGFGRGSALDAPFLLAAKTGTSTGFRDTWAIGVTPRWTVAVWAGNFDGAATRQMSGATGAAPLMVEIAALERGRGGPARSRWPAPTSLQKRRVCWLSGQSAEGQCSCSRRMNEWFRRPTRGASGHVDVRGFHAYVTDSDDLANSCPMHTSSELGEALDVPVTWRHWARQEHLLLATHTDHKVAARMVHPIDGDRFRAGGEYGEAKIELRAAAPALTGEHGSLWWWIDGERWRPARPPYRTFWPLSPGEHRVGIGRASPAHVVTIHVE